MVLLGASNLARGVRNALDEASSRVAPETSVYVACGHGRSYGLASTFLARGLPAVLDCGLWRALAAPPQAALCADIGNDLAYGVAPERVLAWVRAVAERLRAQRLVLAGLPLARLELASPRALAFWSRVFFPARAIEPARLLAAARELEFGLAQLARELSATHVALPADWYGLDPIHFARRARRAAWSTLCAPFGPRVHELRSPALVGRLAPEASTLCGIARHAPQPCARTTAGSRVFLY